MVAECLRENAVSTVARRHRVAPAQLFRWKKAFAPAASGAPSSAGPKAAEDGEAARFVPVTVPALGRASKRGARPARKAGCAPAARAVEIAFANGCVLRLPADLDAAALARLIRALKA